jgi:hypothetical protein
MKNSIIKSAKTSINKSETQQVKKLSKVGEWLRSGKSIGGVYDIKAIML